LAWKLIRDDVDNFCREMHEGKDNLVIFCSDHGDNFGDQGWQYHFSNVTDGGNRVPVFWLHHEQRTAETKTHNVSSRHIHHDILQAAGADNEGFTLFEERENNLPMLQSYWYDNEGLTMPKYKFNQAAFIHNDKRFVQRAGKWMMAPVGNGGAEPVFEYVENNFNPMEELNFGVERKKYLQQSMNDFSVFSDIVMNNGK
jgi:arylsulfatase A-like enzyme